MTKKLIIPIESLPITSISRSAYEIRYRIVAEDKNRTSAWTPIFTIDPEFEYSTSTINVDTFLKTALLYIDSENHSGQTAPQNLGTLGGTLQDGQFGNPIFLKHTGNSYFYSQGDWYYPNGRLFNSESVTIPDNVDIYVRYSFDQHGITSSAWGVLFEKWYSSNYDIDLLMLYFDLDSTPGTWFKRPGFQIGDVSGNTTAIDATAAVPYAVDEVFWLRATLVRNNGSGSAVANFYHAPDSDTIPTTWTQLGTQVTGTARNQTYPNVEANKINFIGGDHNYYGSVNGSRYRIAMKNLDTGNFVFDFDFTQVENENQTMFYSSVSNLPATYTGYPYANPTSTLVTKSKWYSYDYLGFKFPHSSQLNFGTTNSFTIMACYHVLNSDTSAIGNKEIIVKKAGAAADGVGWEIYENKSTASIQVESSSETDIVTSTSSLNRKIVFLVVDRATSKVTMYENGQPVNSSTLASAQSFDTTEDIIIGTGKVSDAWMGLYSAAVFNKALSESEIQQISNSYGAGSPYIIIENIDGKSISASWNPVYIYKYVDGQRTQLSEVFNYDVWIQWGELGNTNPSSWTYIGRVPSRSISTVIPETYLSESGENLVPRIFSIEIYRPSKEIIRDPNSDFRVGYGSIDITLSSMAQINNDIVNLYIQDDSNLAISLVL